MKKKSRRGRKPGDGVLREIDPQGSALANAEKFVFGRTANEPAAELVRTWLWLTKRLKENETLCQKLIVRLTGTPPTIQSLSIPPEHHDEEKERQLLSRMQTDWEADAFTKLAEVEARLKPLFSLPDWEVEKKLPAGSTDADAFIYFKERDFLTYRLKDENAKLLLRWKAAFAIDPAGWLRKVLAAVEIEIEAGGKATFPLHLAAQELAGLSN